MFFRIVTRRVYPRRNRKAYLRHKEAARALVHARIPILNAAYGFKVGRIAIRDQKSRWGSCSSRGNLNFNYKIALLPPHLADYLIIHELCHLGEFNHSQKFWDLVGQTVPDYLKLSRELKKLHIYVS